jgi:predicted PurR-regulated permease PerM
VIGLFVGSLWLSIELVEEKAEAYKEEFAALYQEVQQWAAEYGLQLGGETDVDSGQGQQDSAVSKALPTVLLPALGQRVSGFVSGLTLVIAFFILGLIDVHAFWERFGTVLDPSKSEQWLKPIGRMINDFQRYIVVRTAVGLITGNGIWIFCVIVDLDFAFVWGFLILYSIIYGPWDRLSALFPLLRSPWCSLGLVSKPLLYS